MGLFLELKFNPIQAGVFWNHIGWRHNVPPPLVSPLFVVQLQPNLAWWYSGTNLSKVIKSLLMSSLGGKYDVIKLFLVSFQVKIRFPYLLSNEAEIWQKGQFWGTDFEFEPKNPANTFWRRKMRFFTKNWNFCPSASWQKCCHGNTLGYC